MPRNLLCWLDSRLVNYMNCRCSDLEQCAAISHAGPTAVWSSLANYPHLASIQQRSTTAGLAHIVGLKHLTDLSLRDTKITDAGLVRLVGLPLTKFDLAYTAVTDAGVVHLMQMRNLKELNLIDTNLSCEGVSRLRSALPQCDITFKKKDASSPPAGK